MCGIDKPFLITVDTEGDNLWTWKKGTKITTRNAEFIPRFQDLCEKYGLKPTYLTNYEMAQDRGWTRYSSQKASQDLCEIGLHIHAWNTPPFYDLQDKFGGNPYITEYPEDIIEAKVENSILLLQEAYETDIKSHRSGRWALNSQYLNILSKHGITVDCSVTPELDLSNCPGCSQMNGNDYRGYPTQPYYIIDGMLEVPMTSRHIRKFTDGGIKHNIKNLLLGEDMWLRPIHNSLSELIYLTKRVTKGCSSPYLEFMVHSSELMPGGSIFFKTDEEIEHLYSVMDQYFNFITNMGFTGMTLQQFAEVYSNAK